MNVGWVCRVIAFAFLVPPLIAPAQTPTYFQFTAGTGINATIALPLSAQPRAGGVALQSGDEVGVFTPEGLCVGGIVWASANAAITVWGDDIQTPQVDGARPGEVISFRVWRKAVSAEYSSVRVTYTQGNGVYAPNAVFIIASLGDYPTRVDGLEFPGSDQDPDHLWIYPNPFNPSASIVFGLEADVHVRLQVLDMTGRVVTEPFIGHSVRGMHTVHYDARSLPSGTYVCRLLAGQFTESRLIAIVR